MAWHDGTVTAPLTPPHQPNPHDPWQSPPSGSHLAPAYDSPDDPDTATELRQAAVVTVLVALAGIALGLLWLWLAPRVPLVSDGSAVFLQNSEGEEAIGADGTFVLLAAVFGVLSAVAVAWRLRRGGVLVVVGLALGGVLGSLLAWRVGIWLGPSSDVVARAREVGKGVVFDAPLELHAVVAVLVWPFVALAVHVLLTAAFGVREPEPAWVGEGWTSYYGEPGAGGSVPPGSAGPGGPGGPPAGGPGGS
ncbi:ABC transporter permease [Streptomyces cyaneofuscatus]|uniref:ABC transporter permease n=1 Tax=Streptomyces cyaneofuscatus TaxID=66883 RepID=UPI003864B05D|nr:ABC transporter permease [Streptomyces cyaneofuscatus]